MHRGGHNATPDHTSTGPDRTAVYPHAEAVTLMQRFRDQTCSQFDTVELPHEVATQSRHQCGQMKISSKGPTYDAPVSSHKIVPSQNTTSSHEGGTMQATSLSIPSSHKLRKLNLLITKFHFLGDYIQTIQQFGCTDSFSTQIIQYLFLYRKSKC